MKLGVLMACQIPCLRRVATGAAAAPPASLARRLKLMLRRHLSPSQERTLKARTNDLLNRLAGVTGRGVRPAALAAVAVTHLQAGDLVRVRPKEEIEATLNHWRQLRGCAFMPEMAQYCGSTQRILKTMERFVDERDLRVKRSRGIVLLEGVICQGTADFGRCDRACHLFWREEWLEKID
ncbi:MAG TPA: hypothetical protein PLJ35_18185 [Anaerolineae bacterium]|nr:hypothetical protein [Anaerolineae bacterium]HOR00747.1 hypothetical protein [Anaerolineae bacterium]HPL27250.1 hypothetical protein [Anaerolineae bacterium]